ncbi:hypothetical protein V8C35DRAFT_326495 [Trichoderma chlorosporum]
MCYREYAHCKFCGHTVLRISKCLTHRVARSLQARGIFKQASEEDTMALCRKLTNAIYYFGKGDCPKYNMGCDSFFLNMNIWHPSVRATNWSMPQPDADQDMSWAYEDPVGIPAEKLPKTFAVVRGNPSLL